MSVDNKSAHEAQLLQEIHKTLINGSHILHHHGILDAYGHLSARHPTNPDLFIMPRNMAPATITESSDLVIYRNLNATPVEEDAPRGYIERYIHSEIYRAYPHINSVIHAHTAAVLPYANSDVPLQASLHMAGFLGLSTPVFDISKYYKPDDEHNLLITTSHLGHHLAAHFVNSGDSLTEGSNAKHHATVLMRGHGYTVVGSSIRESVFRAVYTVENAKIQTNTLLLAGTYSRLRNTVVETRGVYENEIEDSSKIGDKSSDRAWNLWLREIEVQPLYACKVPNILPRREELLGMDDSKPLRLKSGLDETP